VTRRSGGGGQEGRGNDHGVRPRSKARVREGQGQRGEGQQALREEGMGRRDGARRKQGCGYMVVKKGVWQRRVRVGVWQSGLEQEIM